MYNEVDSAFLKIMSLKCSFPEESILIERQEIVNVMYSKLKTR